MMRAVLAAQVVNMALSLVKREGVIPYVLGGESLSGMDCQGFVEYCVRQCGGQMDFAGSNDMFRNACAWVGTVAEAKQLGRLLPGAALFILKQDGNEPARYQADGLGNASHIGLYLGDAQIEAAHSSSGKGKVCQTTLANGWTHVGLIKAIDYETKEAASVTPMTMTVWAESGKTVNLRAMPDPAAKSVARVPIGEGVLTYGETGNYTRVAFAGMDGYMETRFLLPDPEKGMVPVAELLALIAKYGGDA